ncbi:MAG: hypothetical protein LC745_04035 [Planctomycetia bacterium]|nr:hypothetical protein [Planctomycetia bacterium]
MPDRARIISNVLGLIGAAAGGVFGHVLFQWIARQGFYALIVPGGMLGLGCGLLARHPSWPRGVVCGLSAVVLGFYSEWSNWPFNADDRFSYFLAHVSDLKPVTLLMVTVGALIAFWLGKDAGYGRPLPEVTPVVRTRE